MSKLSSLRLTEHEREFPPVIDSTMIAALACHRRWTFAYEENFTASEGKSIHLMAGAAFAKGLEVMRMSYHQGYYDRPIYEVDPQTGVRHQVRTERHTANNTQDALVLGLEALMLNYDDSIEHNTAKSLDRMCGALEYYAEHFPLDDSEFGVISDISGRPGIEWNFCVPLPVLHPTTSEPLLFCGRTDVILDIYNGQYLVDDKTTSSLGASWPAQWNMRGQFAGYAWAAGELGIRVDGSLVRGVSILKTKYDHAQAIVHQPEWKLNEWLVGTCEKLENAKRLFERRVNIPAFGEACNEYAGCEFSSICMVKDHRQWLDDNFVSRNWNPLERH